MTHTQSYPDSANTPLVLEFTEQELAAVHELSEYHQVSRLQAMRQALRLYQLHEHRIRNGETLTWSGDAARAQDFTGRPIGGVAQSPLNDLIERCAHIAENGCLVPPDGGSPTVEEQELCSHIARVIRGLALPSTNHQSLDQLLDGMTDENRHEELPVSPICTEGK